MTPLDSARPSGLAARSPEAQLAALLALGGDERIAVSGPFGRNRYGCGVMPDEAVLAFASSTASTISPGAFAAAAGRLEQVLASRTPREAYRTGMARVRSRLAQLCGLPPAAAGNIVLAASGTDLHLIAADLARGPGPGPLTTVAADPASPAAASPTPSAAGATASPRRMARPGAKARPSPARPAASCWPCRSAAPTAARARRRTSTPISSRPARRPSGAAAGRCWSCSTSPRPAWSPRAPPARRR
jgi:hypothetical protein